MKGLRRAEPKEERKRTKAEIRDRREERALRIQTWSALVSTAALGASIAALCLNKKGEDEAQSVWLMSESCGLMRWRLRRQRATNRAFTRKMMDEQRTWFSTNLHSRRRRLLRFR